MVRITFSVCRHRASVACTAVVMAAVGSNPRSAAGSFPARQLATPLSTAVPRSVAGAHVTLQPVVPIGTLPASTWR